MIRPLLLLALLSTPTLAQPKAAPAKPTAAPASGAKAITSQPLRRIKGPIKLYGSDGKPHPAMKAGIKRVKANPAVLKRAAQFRANKALHQPVRGFTQQGKYWVKTQPTINPKHATVTQWMRLVKGAIRSARVAPPPPKQPASLTP
jgi:hypothetical protein